MYLVLEAMPDTSRCQHFVSSGSGVAAYEQSLARICGLRKPICKKERENDREIEKACCLNVGSVPQYRNFSSSCDTLTCRK